MLVDAAPVDTADRHQLTGTEKLSCLHHEQVVPGKLSTESGWSIGPPRITVLPAVSGCGRRGRRGRVSSRSTRRRSHSSPQTCKAAISRLLPGVSWWDTGSTTGNVRVARLLVTTRMASGLEVRRDHRVWRAIRSGLVAINATSRASSRPGIRTGDRSAVVRAAPRRGRSRQPGKGFGAHFGHRRRPSERAAAPASIPVAAAASMPW
jgi:hypothetical protein